MQQETTDLLAAVEHIDVGEALHANDSIEVVQQHESDYQTPQLICQYKQSTQHVTVSLSRLKYPTNRQELTRRYS